MPAGPIKCAGAPQKIAYLAADWWRSQGVLDRTRVILVLPTAAMFSQPDWAKVLEGIAAGYGIEVRKESQLTEVDGDAKRAVIADTKAGTKETVDYDILHAVPPQSPQLGQGDTASRRHESVRLCKSRQAHDAEP